MIDLPLAAKRSTISKILRLSASPKAAVGSSKIKIFASLEISLATSTKCCSPTESKFILVVGSTSVKPTSLR